MGRAEMIILIGAIAILGRYSLTVNDALAGNEIIVLQSNYELSAVSIVQGIFNEAWLKSFDEETVSGFPAQIPTEFTVGEQMGPESGESYPYFDDVDDYNSLSISDTSSGGLPYTLDVTVGYIEAADKDTYVSYRTTLKRMDVSLSSDYLRNTISFSRIYPYWK